MCTTAMTSMDYNPEPYATTREKPITILWGVNLEMVSLPGVIIACKFIMFIEHVPVGMLHESDTKLTLSCALLNFQDLCRHWIFVKPLCHFLWNSFMYILEHYGILKKLLGICSCWSQFTVWIHESVVSVLLIRNSWSYKRNIAERSKYHHF